MARKTAGLLNLLAELVLERQNLHFTAGFGGWGMRRADDQAVGIGKNALHGRVLARKGPGDEATAGSGIECGAQVILALVVGGVWLVYILRRWRQIAPAPASVATPSTVDTDDDYLRQVEQDIESTN